jgi:hypothetical protein
MQLTLSIVSLFFVVSALGNPVTSDTTVVELDPRQSCDVGSQHYLLYLYTRHLTLPLFPPECLSTIGTETGGIISACGTAAGDLERIGAAILQNKPPGGYHFNSQKNKKDNVLSAFLPSSTAQADITALASDTIKCVFQSVSAGFAIVSPNHGI